MRTLFFYQHFWPDSPPYANMLRVIGQALAEKNNTVSVITSQPSYKNIDRQIKSEAIEVLDGIHIKRLSLLPGARKISLVRLFGKAVFPFRACVSVILDRLRGRKHDVIVAATIPPIINGFFALIAAKCSGALFVYHMQDIYPEIGAVAGLWKSEGYKHKLLKWLDVIICKNADVCIVLSTDMRETLISRGVDSSRIAIINNFMLANFTDHNHKLSVERTPSSLIEKGDKFKLVFAGNLGRFQGLEALVAAFQSFSKSNHSVELHFIGEGTLVEKLKTSSSVSNNVFFHGHKPFDEACQLMSLCDAGIVSIQPEIYRYAYPSKTLTYLGLGLPILALVESQSELAKVIDKWELGVSANIKSDELIKTGLKDLVLYLSSESNNREAIKRHYSEFMSTDAVLPQWEKLIDSLTAEDVRASDEYER